jgi:hypothetical protein
MCNMKVMLIITYIYWSAWKQIREKLQASTGGGKHINTEEVNKQNKDEEKYTKKVITTNYITQER